MRSRHSIVRATFRLFASRAGVLLGLVVACGCGDGKIPLYPVTGTVLVDGQPAAGAMVIFCPVQGQPEDLMRERPFGHTGADGKFQLTTFVIDDGAPSGEFKVLIQWLSNAGRGAPAGQDTDRGGGGGVDRLRGRYMNLERTPLTASVEEGGTEVPPFELTSR